MKCCFWKTTFVVAFAGTLIFPAASIAYTECQVIDPAVIEAPVETPDSRTELSGVALSNGNLLTVSDDAFPDEDAPHVLQVFAPHSTTLKHQTNIRLDIAPDGKVCNDFDFEGLASSGDTVFAVTSHSRKRKKQKTVASLADPSNQAARDALLKKNKKRLSKKKFKRCDGRYQLIQAKLTDELTLEAVTFIALEDVLKAEKTFTQFLPIPSKENGVDIEGIAITDEYLYVGFRGPVFRQDYVPVLRLAIKDGVVQTGDPAPHVLFTQLGGRGIRGMTAIKDGLLLIGGPVGTEPRPFTIYAWTGQDQVLANDALVPAPTSKPLCEIRPIEGANPEGIAVVEEGADFTDVLVVFDKEKSPTYLVQKLRVPR